MKKIKALCALLPVFLLGGCWSRTEISDLSIVMGVAIEKNDKGEIGLLTQVVVPENVGLGSGDGRGNGESYVNIYTDCKYLAEGMVRAGNQSDKEIYLSHNLILLISEEMAKEGIYPQLDYIMRNNELRLNVLLFVTENDIREIMDVKSETFQIPATYIASLGVALGQNSDGTNKDVLEFVTNMLEKSNGSLIPIVTLDKTSEPTSLKVTSSAVFKDDKMIGKLSADETRGIMWLTDHIISGEITTELEGNIFSARINSSKTKRKTYIDDNDNVSVRADIEAELFIKRDIYGYITADNIGKVKEAFEEQIKSEIYATLEKMRESGTDVYGFAQDLYRTDFKAWERLKDDWDNIYKNLYVDVNINISMRETGSIDRSILKERE